MDRETEIILILAARTLRFATDHPYAATGLLGAMAGSAVTYRALMFKQQRPAKDGIFTPKMYRLALSNEDLRHLLENPTNEIKWETPEISVTITSEEPEQLKQLPVVEYEAE